MNDNLMFERSARAWLELGPEKAPDEAVRAALFEIETTPQQEHVLRVSWMRGRLTTLAPAVGMGLVLAIAVVAASLLDRGAPTQVAGPNPNFPGAIAASASPAPIASPASSRPSPTMVPFDLSTRFTSTRYGYSIALDPRWTVTPASELWRLDDIDDPGPSADEVAIGVSQLTGASEALKPGQTLDQWLADFPAALGGCTQSPALWGVVQVGPVSGRLDVICSGEVAIAEAGGRVYVFSWGFGGYSDLDNMSRGGFATVLQTVRFDAASVPSASAGPVPARP